MRFGRASGTTQTAVLYIGTNIESQQMKLLAGKAIVLSFYAKKGADFSYTPTVRLYSGTGTDQSPVTLFNGVWTGGADVVNTTFSPTATMTRYTFTGTVPTTSNELSFFINWTPSGTAGGNEWLQIEGVQLEIGSVATEFQRSGGTLQGELAACQRYYFRFTGPSAYSSYGQGYFEGAGGGKIDLPYPVTMRTQPSSIDFANVAAQDSATTIIAITGLTINQSSLKTASLDFTVASGGTAHRPCRFINNNNAAGYVGLNAEL